MKSKNGFTLIELLAVIVILAVIALIAVPIVLNIIEKARKSAAKSSALTYIKAVETYLVASKLDKDALELKKNNSYNCTKNTIIEDKNYLPINDLVELKGYKPTGSKDIITINNKNEVEAGTITVNGYSVNIKDKEIASIVKGPHIKVESLGLNYSEQTMEKGSDFELKPVFTPKDASDQRVTYTSSDESIVTVTETGKVTAKKNGNARVTVTSKEDTSKKAECNITVITSATGVSIEPSESEIEVGKTVQLKGTIEPGDVTTNALEWTSSNESVAHVDENGLVTGMSAGGATITARTVNGKEATSTIKVKVVEAESVSLNKTSLVLGQDETAQLNATITPNNTIDKTLTWTSSNTSVATVSNNGLVTGKNVGSANISVKTSNNKTATVAVTVNKCNVGQVYNYAYTGGSQTFTPKCTGRYKLEVWGAQGGGTNGGKGGYSLGSLDLKSIVPLKIYVGGQPSNGTGGYNGGGASAYTTGYGGGGATDIRLNSTSLYARVIVAGAGGGYHNDNNYVGGYGGGNTGGQGGSMGNNNEYSGNPGTQTSGGKGKNNSIQDGSFGQGGPGYTTHEDDSSTSYRPAGGGSGWYGGSGGHYAYSAGCGGSGYVYTSSTASNYPSGCLLNSSYYLTNAQTIAGDQTFKAPSGSNETGHTGNGYARITYLGK